MAAARDCAFLLSFIAGIGAFFIFLVAFVNAQWTGRDGGFMGLWSDCNVNRSLPGPEQIDCVQTARADGPVFLEIVRTLLILALVFEVMGITGYNWFLPKPSDKDMKRVVKERLQEISYFVAGVLIIAGVVIYGLHHHEYYTDTKDYTDVKLLWAFYLESVAGSLTLVCSIVMVFTKYTDRMIKKEKLRLAAAEKAMSKSEMSPNSSKMDNSSRFNSKEKKTVPDLLDTGRENEKDINDQVVVKTSALKKIATPTNVILAFNRIKSGKGNKRKPASDTRLFTPTTRKSNDFDERSLSSHSSSSDNDDDDDNANTHRNRKSTSANNKNSQRQKVKRSATTLTDNSTPWALTVFELTNEENNDSAKQNNNNNNPRRHVSHSAIQQPHNKQTTIQQPSSLPAVIPEKGIYTIPTEGHTHDLLAPPKYDEVIESRDHGEVPVPAPMMTDQSKIFQPYSKSEH